MASSSPSQSSLIEIGMGFGESDTSMEVASSTVPAPSAASTTPLAPASGATTTTSTASIILNYDSWKNRLLGSDWKDALSAAREIRQAMDVILNPNATTAAAAPGTSRNTTGTEFPLLLTSTLPALSTVLTNRTRPSPDPTSVSYQLRLAVLDILAQFPLNAVTRPHAPHLVTLVLSVIQNDYQEQALAACRILFDLYKVYRTLPPDQVQHFMDFVMELYRNLPAAVPQNFQPPKNLAASPTSHMTQVQSTSLNSSSSSATIHHHDDVVTEENQGQKPRGVDTDAKGGEELRSSLTLKDDAASSLAGDNPVKSPSYSSASSPSSQQQQQQSHIRSNMSFRVLIECPLIVMLLFQLYPKFVKINIPAMISVMMNALSLRAPRFQDAATVVQPEQAQDSTADSMATTPQKSNKSNQDVAAMNLVWKRCYYDRFRDLIAAQAKTLSFLTYLLRSFASDLRPHAALLANHVVALLATCPKEMVPTRKELLVATRHLMNAGAEFRAGFLAHLDSLLDERVLLGGTGSTSGSSLGSSSHLLSSPSSSSSLGGSSTRVVSSDQTLLRPLAYTTLSELIQHFSSQMTLQHLSRVVLICSRILHAHRPGPGLGIQSSSLSSNFGSSSSNNNNSMQYAAIRNLFSVIDVVYRNTTGASTSATATVVTSPQQVQQGRSILVRIMRTLVDKLYSLVETFPLLMAKNGEGANTAFHEDENPTIVDIVAKQSNLGYSTLDSVRELQSMVRAIVVNLKTLMNYISSCNNHGASEDAGDGDLLSDKHRPTLTQYEIEIVHRYIAIIFPATNILKENISEPASNDTTRDGGIRTSSQQSSNAPESSHQQQQYRDALTYFAASFAQLDGTSLRKTLGQRLDCLVDAIVQDSIVMIIPRHLLACSSSTSFHMSSILLDHLVNERIEELSVRGYSDVQKDANGESKIVFLPPLDDNDESLSLLDLIQRAFAGPKESLERLTAKSNTILQLFERVLKSLAAFPENEFVVRKYLRRMVAKCFRSAMEHVDEWPDANCLLLRYIFRSISAGKFEESYRELLPLIPAVLNGLYRVLTSLSSSSSQGEGGYDSSSSSVIAHTAIELCLTIPARLSSLLPHLNLLLRVIVPALDSDSGDLVNLGLRTLEFWIDNLNPSFLYPEISKQVDLLSMLMRSLCRHLQPAPYPYGLLTLRLLGKLGGKNRQFLRDTLPIVGSSWYGNKLPLMAQCSWKVMTDIPTDHQTFELPIPLRSAVDMLKKLLFSEPILPDKRDESIMAATKQKRRIAWAERGELWNRDLDKIDFETYSLDVMSETKSSQCKAAFQVVVAALNCILEKTKAEVEIARHRFPDHIAALRDEESMVCVGLLFAASLEATHARAKEMLQSFLPSLEPAHAAGAFTDFLKEIPENKASDILLLIREVVESEWQVRSLDESGSGGFSACLLRSLCGACSSNKLGKQTAIMGTLLILLEAKGQVWSRTHEGELVAAAFVSVKTAPREIALVSAKAAEFFIRVCDCLYGLNLRTTGESWIDAIVWDPLDTTRVVSESPKDNSGSSESQTRTDSGGPSEEALRIALQEIVSPQHLVRFCSRFFLKQFVLVPRGATALSDHSSTMRRLLFSRHLRFVPLPHQVGMVEALAFLLLENPTLFLLTDTHTINFLSELLKMCSVADGEMQDKSLAEVVVDKNGFAASVGEKGLSFSTQPSAIFFRRNAIVDVNGAKVVVSEELAPGIQLRLAAIVLVHAVVRGHTDFFFDSDASTSIGNIRPHMISLLFRSLVSNPREAVAASHCALRDVLALSPRAAAKVDDQARSQSRLPKDLLQTCIRPVLLNLKEYTRLSIPLLRGLCRLLSLLSSWFNKTLGEKLMDHLKKWTDPQQIESLRIWNEGEEPLVAAAIVGVFWLLPHGSKFVEPLVMTCLKIEGVLGDFKMHYTNSPFRQPLARFLNKYPQATVDFFFQRLKYPIYSELFLFILRQSESVALRECLCGKQVSLMLLNACFERPLAILRSEKSGNSPGPGQSPLILHGVGVSNAGQNSPVLSMTQDALEVQLQGLKILATLIEHNLSYFAEHGDIIRAMRYLWRSRGRFLRLQYEEQVPPCYQDESLLMSHFLVNYATSVSQVDLDAFVEVMLELLCIFLQSATTNFADVRRFCGEAPLMLLDDEQKKYFVNKILQRLASESNEDTKVLSIQLLLIPLLAGCCRKKTLSGVIEVTMVDGFVNEILFQKGSPSACGDRLRVECLQLLSIFLDASPSSLGPYKREIVRFCSSLLKSDDIACTSWAYILMCQITKVFGTSEKTTRQVYTALIRSHHQEGKELVRVALDVLMPALKQRLAQHDISRLVDQTAQIMVEESNSTPQMAHICWTIIKGMKIFQTYFKKFSGLLTGVLNRLGLSTGGQFESKFLAAEVLRLLLDWEESATGIPQRVFSREEHEIMLNFVVCQLLLLAEPEMRSLKADQSLRSLGETLKDLLGKMLVRFSGLIRPQHFEKALQPKPDHAVLETALDVLIVMSHSKNTLFLEQNRSLVTQIVSASFDAARENNTFRAKINDFAEHAIVVPGQDDVIAISLEKIVLETAQSFHGKTPLSEAVRGSKSGVKENRSQTDLSFSAFALTVIASLCQYRKSLFSRLESSLLVLGSMLAKEHVSHAIAKQRQGSSSTTKTTSTGILQHTPTRGILDEILKRKRQDWSRQSSTRNRSMNKNTENGDSQRCLFLILSIFEDKELFYFTQRRKTMYQIISSLLEQSDNIMVLMISTRIAGKWLVASGGGSSVVVKERSSLLSKLSFFDSCLLGNDVSAQPLADLICHFVQYFREVNRKSDDLVFGKTLVACLLNSNVTSRKEIFEEYLSASGEEPLGVLDLIWRVLLSDFERIGGRFWLVILVEAMLSAAECNELDLIPSLRVLIHGDENICQILLEHMFPTCWGFLDNSVRANLARALEQLLSRPYNAQFLRPGHFSFAQRAVTNTPRAILNVTLLFQPVPLFDTNLLVFLGENYNAWYEVLSLFEKLYCATQNHPVRAKSLSAMRHCYRHLSEDQIWMSLARESCIVAETKKAISLDVGGFLGLASDSYLDLIDLVNAESTTLSPSDFEMDLWEQRWIEIQRQLCQLEVVSEFGNASANHRLQLECAWRTQDWAKVRALCASPDLLVSAEIGDATVKLSETLLAVTDGKLVEVENLHAQSAQLCLYKWQLLPQLTSASPIHTSLLHFFHRLVEVRESGQIMVETNSHSEGRTLPDLKNLLNAWRGRLPNHCEPIILWDEILSWRNHMFEAITNKFSWSDPGTLATLHDRPWTVIRLAKTARKQDLRNVSLLLLSKVSEKSTMNVLDAYLQLREQILAYMNPSSESERYGGLNLVNTTNLSFFNPSQRSELFRLKATFLASLSNRTKANQAFCHCVQICPSHALAWVDWGNLCAELGGVAELQTENASGDPHKDKAATAKKVAQYLAQAIGCYLESVRLDTHEWARLHIAKCLLMLSKDGGSPGVLCSTFESRGSLLPSWVWLPWLPQLLSGLIRPEGPGLKQLLTLVAKSYPQSIYYPLRAFYLERRDVERARGPSSSGSTNQHMPSVVFSEELLTLLRRSHASLCSLLETVLEELIVKFRPSTEEDFLGTIIALEERLEGQISGLRKSEEESMSLSCWKTLGRIAIKYFKPVDSGSRQDERSRQIADFKDHYRKLFEDDFQVSAIDAQDEVAPASLASPVELLAKIRHWREKLQTEVLAGPSSIRLIDVSRSLAIYGMGEPPDLWPGACDPKYAPSHAVATDPEFNPDGGSVQSTTSSSTAARKAASNAATATAAAAKREGFGGDFGGCSAIIEIPGCYMPNHSWTDSRPNPELHPKLIRFEPIVEIIRRKENLVRRIGMVGDDGKTYRFVLQCALSYWTRTDERTAQTQFVIEKVLRKAVKSARAYLSVKPQPVIPVAQRLRLVLEPDHWTSLEQEYELFLALRSRVNFEGTLATRFSNELHEAFSVSGYGNLEEAQRTKIERETRLKLFRSICQSTSALILKNQMLHFLRSTELFFQFRRTFSKQWAMDCLFQYVFGIAERNPDQVIFFRNSGATAMYDARIFYNNQGFIDKTVVPFRMTRNLSELIGFPLQDGLFVPTMATASEAITSEKHLLDPILHLLLRDDLVAYYTKSVAKPDTKTQEMEKQLNDRISKNVSTVQARFASCSPNVVKHDSSDDSVYQHIHKLLSLAQKDEQICLMPSAFQGWL